MPPPKKKENTMRKKKMKNPCLLSEGEEIQVKK